MKQYFKIGEISKLYHIGPDSLRYYEELGILTPKRGKNHYRLYSIQDLWRLNIIRDLRSLGFSMERIRDYLNNRSIESTELLLEDELKAVEEHILLLNRLKENVSERLETLRSAKEHPVGIIEKKQILQRHCHIIHSGYDTDEEMDMLIKQLLNKDTDNLYLIGNNKIGSILPINAVNAQNYRGYESVFIIDKLGSQKLAGGTYLTVSYRGSCNQNAVYIPRLLSYAKKQNLIPKGPVLELLWIDIHQAENEEEHITELQLLCCKPEEY